MTQPEPLDDTLREIFHPGQVQHGKLEFVPVPGRPGHFVTRWQWEERALCHYCGTAYPAPVELHHDETECAWARLVNTLRLVLLHRRVEEVSGHEIGCAALAFGECTC